MRGLLIVALTMLALAGCKPEAEEEEGVLPPVGEERLAIERTSCEVAGGAWREDTLGAFCQYPTRDGGERCERGTDCEGACLARSQTCAPVRPLLGCNEVLTSSGFRVTECIE